MGALTVIGSGVGAFIMGMAALSPCPLLVNHTSGGVIIVSSAQLSLIYENVPHHLLIHQIKSESLFLRTNLRLSCVCSTGVGLDRLRSHAVLREGDHRCDPARRGPQRPRVVWSGSSAGLSAGSCDHVPTGQRVRLLLLRRPVQHRVSLKGRLGGAA